MRFVKTATIGMFLVTMLVGGSAMGQADFDCDDIVRSSNDTLFVPFSAGKPGDTVLIPVFLKNDSIVTSFQFLIEYDSTWLTPVALDTQFFDFVIGERLLKTDTTQGPFGPEIDTVNNFTINLFQDEPNVLSCSQLPDALSGLDSLPRGGGEIFFIKFEVDSLMPHNALAQFTFFSSNIISIDETVFPPDTSYFDGCNTSQMSAAWQVDDTTTESRLFFPTTDLGFGFFFRADTGFVEPTTVNLSANPDSIGIGQSTTLSWTSSMADSVVLTDQVGARLSGSANGSLSGSLLYTPPGEGTFTVTATAYAAGVAQATDPVDIKVGTDEPQGDGPNVTVSGVLNSYNQGELIAFTVTATNTSGAQITINASSLPANANFGSGGIVTGVSPLTGTFSWTPDVNQFGVFTIRFAATDAGGTTTRNVVLQINELQFDRLFSTSRQGNRPVGGLRGRKGIAFPIDLVTSQTVYGVQFDMSWPANLVKIDSFITTARTFDYIVVHNLNTVPGMVRVVSYNLDNQPVRDTNTTAVLQAILTLDSSASAWANYTIGLSNGRESVNPDPNVGSLPLVTDSGIVQIDSVGDVNLDKFIDVDDVVGIVASIINNFTLTPRQFETADVVPDGAVNVFDLVADVNLIFSAPVAPVSSPAGPAATMSLAYNDVLAGGSEMVVVNSEIPQASEVAGVQLEVSYDPSSLDLGKPELTQHDGAFTLQYKNDSDGKLTMLLYQVTPPGSGTYFEGGFNSLVEIPMTARTVIKTGDKTKLRLSDALLSTSLAAAIPVSGVDRPLPLDFTLSQNYPNPFNPTTTIEFAVPNGQADINLDVYNVLGQHVTTLFEGRYPAGQYEVTWDATDRNGKRVATGVYLYRLKVGDERKTKKMLFLK